MEKITVLLVEDEQTLAMIIKDTLEGQNFIIHLSLIHILQRYKKKYRKDLRGI